MIDNGPCPQSLKSNGSKATIQLWLVKTGIEFSVIELRERVKFLIPKKKMYDLVKIALKIGYEDTKYGHLLYIIEYY